MNLLIPLSWLVCLIQAVGSIGTTGSAKICIYTTEEIIKLYTYIQQYYSHGGSNIGGSGIGSYVFLATVRVTGLNWAIKTCSNIVFVLQRSGKDDTYPGCCTTSLSTLTASSFDKLAKSMSFTYRMSEWVNKSEKETESKRERGRETGGCQSKPNKLTVTTQWKQQSNHHQWIWEHKYTQLHCGDKHINCD